MIENDGKFWTDFDSSSRKVPELMPVFDMESYVGFCDLIANYCRSLDNIYIYNMFNHVQHIFLYSHIFTYKHMPKISPTFPRQVVSIHQCCFHELQ